MVERKAFMKLAEYDGNPIHFDVWAYKMRGFLQTEPEYVPLLSWIERLALLEEDEQGRRPMSLLGSKVKAMPLGGDPWHGTS